MRKIWISILWLVAASNMGAADMMHLLGGGYDAKVMTPAELDSVLNGTTAVNTPSSGQYTSQNAAERYRLEYENAKKLFRHSFFADYYLVDTQKNTRIALSDTQVRDAKLSPNGKYVVYAKADNNLYIYKVDFKTEVPVTTSNNLDIFNGITDWLYEEEFGITDMFYFSPDSKALAFVRLNETSVPAFEWQTYLPDSVTQDDGTYPTMHSLRYPKAGQANAKATVCVYDIHYKSIREMQIPANMDGYIPRLKWRNVTTNSKSSTEAMADLMILHLNRDQNKLDVLQCNAKSTVCHPFYTEYSDTYYVDYELFDEWQWLSDGKVVLLSEKSGYKQVYLYSSQGVEQKTLTTEKRDVTKVYGVDEKTQTLYYQAATTALIRHAYAYNMRKGTTTQLTKEPGTHALTFSKDWTQYIDCYQSNTTPNRYTLYYKNGASKVLLTNDSVAAAWQTSGYNDKEYFTLTTERGDTLNAWRILPVDFDASKKYPVVMMQYSGPSSQRVTDTWRKRFGHQLSMEGYLVVCVDGRGTNARGRAWRNATYMQLGKKEAEDQISAAQYLQTLPYVDAHRIALCGWSYGGYQTLMSMSMQPAGGLLWKCGIAIAPVTSWRLYDSAYTERYMRRPQVNEYGYDGTDLMKIAGDLQGKLLLVHGLADDNVHAQQSWQYVDALVQAGKQFEMQFYPDDNHFLRARNNYRHLHERLLQFLKNNL